MPIQTSPSTVIVELLSGSCFLHLPCIFASIPLVHGTINGFWEYLAGWICDSDSERQCCEVRKTDAIGGGQLSSCIKLTQTLMSAAQLFFSQDLTKGMVALPFLLSVYKRCANSRIASVVKYWFTTQYFTRGWLNYVCLNRAFQLLTYSGDGCMCTTEEIVVKVIFGQGGIVRTRGTRCMLFWAGWLGLGKLWSSFLTRSS